MHKRLPLVEALAAYHEEKVTPFDVPGHKHGKGLRDFGEFWGERVVELDVNSMKCLDNISHPVGVIKDAEALLADVYGADHSFFLVNGTTSGVQAMIMSVCDPGDKILIPRNSHKSAVNALILSGAVPVYIEPEYDMKLGIAMGITVEKVAEAIAEHPDAKAVFVINPTYYGVASDLEQIVKLSHDNNMVVLVDEAHGAHLKFNGQLPISAMEAGADISAVSLHKTGGALTQASALLIRSEFIDKNKVRSIINLTQTTSASYVLMSSLDFARRNLALNGEAKVGEVLELSRYMRDEINKIEGLYAFGKEILAATGMHAFDETKLSINCSGLGISGFKLYDVLREDYAIQMELADTHNTLAIISLGDDRSSAETLLEALKELSKRFFSGKTEHKKVDKVIVSKLVKSPRDAFFAPKRRVKITESVGLISGESLMVYPPGIPILAPGEVITAEMIDYIEFLKKEEAVLTDIEDKDIDYIKVLDI